MGSLLDRVRRVIGRERAGPLLGLFAGALLIVALPAQAALAADLSYAGRTFTYQADPDEPNTLVVSKQQGANLIIFEDSGVTIDVVADPLGICLGSGTDVVRCYNNSDGPPPTTGPGFNLLIINLDNLEDTVHNNTNIKSEIDGGTENDELWGGDSDDLIEGGDGDDEIHGGNGNDELNGDEGDDVISGDDGDDLIFGGDGEDDLSGGNNDDIIHTGLGTGEDPETVLGGDGDDVVFFEYDADPATVTVSKSSLQEIFVDTDDNSLRLVSTEQLHIFNDTEDGEDDYVIGDLTGRPLKVLVLQSNTDNDAEQLTDLASITAEGTSGDDKIVLQQFNEIGTILPELSMGDGQGPWGKIVFRGPPAGDANSTFITVNSRAGNDVFDVDLSLPLGNEVGITLNGGTGTNTVNFSRPQGNVFQLDLSQDPVEPEAGVVDAGSALGNVAFTDVTLVTLDGKGQDIEMTIITPEDTEDIVYTPANQNGTGTVEVNSWPVDSGPDLITFKFQGVGDDGSLVFDNAGGEFGDNLEYNGSSRNETFTVFDDGEITLESTIDSVPVFTPGVQFLTINAGNGNDIIDVTDGVAPFSTVDLNGEDGNDTIEIVGGQTATFTVDGGAPSASDTLILSTPENDGDITVDLENDEVAGYSDPDPIAVSAIEHLVLEGQGNNNLTILGHDGDDEINYTPGDETSGKVEPSGSDIKDIAFSGIGTGDLEIDGQGGDNVIRTIGTSSADEIELTAGVPDSDHSTTQVGDRKALVTHNENTETLAVDSGAGKDTINFNADCDVPLHLLLDGNTPGGTTLSGDVLNVIADGAESRTFSGHDPQSGNIDVCTDEEEPSLVEFERIERIDAGDAGGDDGAGATQPDGVFSVLADVGSDRKAASKSKGANIFGGAGSGKGGQNVTGAQRGARIKRTGGALTIPFIIENDGPTGSDSYRVVFASEVIQKVSGDDADPGVTVTVGGKDISGDGGLVGPIDHSSQLRADIKITTDGAKVGRHKLIFDIFSENGGGEDDANKFVDSVTIYFTIGK